MKLILFLTWREIRFRRKQLLPFVLIAMALIFTSVSLITFQESANVGEPINYMTSPTYMILFSAFALIGFSASRSYFSLLGETVLAEMGTLRALGMKRHMVRRFWLLLGGICIMTPLLGWLPPGWCTDSHSLISPQLTCSFSPRVGSLSH